MTREEAKQLLPLIQAYVEGKEIEFKGGDEKWCVVDAPTFEPYYIKYYRIKGAGTFRPFNSADECFNEMLKHQPVGWLVRKDKDCDEHIHIAYIMTSDDRDERIIVHLQSDCDVYNEQELFEQYNFVDGSPCGIEE